MCAVLVIVAAYYTWDAITSGYLVWLAVPFVLLTVAAGLMSGKTWGVVLWHVFALTISCGWLAIVGNLALSDWPFDNAAQSIVSLIPGISLLMFCVLGSVEVHRKRVRNATAAP
jgi:hypothetical protein